MTRASRRSLGSLFVICALLAGMGEVLSADLGPPSELVQPSPPAGQWQFSFTPYAWATSVNGTVTARGHRLDVDASFFDIVENSDSLMALMGYFEARKGRLAFFTDIVWEDLSFSGRIQRSGRPFQRLPMLISRSGRMPTSTMSNSSSSRALPTR